MSGNAHSWLLILQLYFMLVKSTINHEISLDKYGIKRSRKSYSTNICHSSPYIYFHLKIISRYASVNFFLTHTVYACVNRCLVEDGAVIMGPRLGASRRVGMLSDGPDALCGSNFFSSM